MSDSEPEPYVRKIPNRSDWGHQSSTGNGTEQHNGEIIGGPQLGGTGTAADPSSAFPDPGNHWPDHSSDESCSAAQRSSKKRATSGGTKYRVYIDGVGVPVVHGNYAFLADGSLPGMKQVGRVTTIDWGSHFTATPIGELPQRGVDVFGDERFHGSIHYKWKDLENLGRGGGKTNAPSNSVSSVDRYSGQNFHASQQRGQSTAPRFTRQFTDAERATKDAEAERKRHLDRRLEDLVTREKDLETQKDSVMTQMETLRIDQATLRMAEATLRRRIAEFESGKGSAKGKKASANSGQASAETEEASAGTAQNSARSEPVSAQSEKGSQIQELTRAQQKAEAALRQQLLDGIRGTSRGT